jgi:carbamoyltransferase
VVGWFQGRMEFGPRALGNRSILGDPRHPEMQKRLNLKIKYREGFRPFAPSVLMEECSQYFDLETPSPYMLLVAPVRDEKRRPLPPDYENLELFQRLYHLRSEVPAITHVDYSARIQTVHRETNEKYWRLIRAFQEHTGCGLIVNTSFNVRGEPIVCTPTSASCAPRWTTWSWGIFCSIKRVSPTGRKRRTGAGSTNWISRFQQVSFQLLARTNML